MGEGGQEVGKLSAYSDDLSLIPNIIYIIFAHIPRLQSDLWPVLGCYCPFSRLWHLKP